MSDTPADRMRLAVIVRHGEAESHSPSGDVGRELTAAGRRQAEDVARWLLSEGVAPDVAIVSPATRTRQTWAAMESAGLTVAEVREDRTLYDGDVDDVVEAVASLPDEVGCVVVVAHAPAIPGVAGVVESRCDVPRSWEPATAGVISHAGPWDGFPGDGSVLVACHVPPRR